MKNKQISAYFNFSLNQPKGIGRGMILRVGDDEEINLNFKIDSMNRRTD